MRADRLLSIVMLMQRRGKMSAQALAKELEVSPRTIYRDIETLSAAGIPIYSEFGADGGYQLVDNYQFNLTGLTQEEMNSLLMLKIPEPLAALDVGQKLKVALLKLSAAQWAYAKGVREVQQRIYLDWAWWGQSSDAPPYLQTLYHAVWNDCKVQVRYYLWGRLIEICRIVEPYGLVAKAGVWYLVYSGNDRLSLFRVSDFVEVQALDETFGRPLDFDLETEWRALSTQLEAEKYCYRTVLRVDATVADNINFFLGGVPYRVLDDNCPPPNGWILVEVDFESLETARAQLLSLGAAVEVIEPKALCLSIQNFAEHIMRLYQK